MKDALSPMLDEMNKKEPVLFAKATSIANGILGNLRKAFDIHSPSRKVRAIFNQVMEGAEKGLEDDTPKLLGQATSISNEFLDRLKNIDVTALMDQARAAVYSNQTAVAGAAARSTHTFTETRIVDMSSIPETESPKYVETTINIDGREFAKATTPYISKRLAWEG